MNRSKLLVGMAALALALSACSEPNAPTSTKPTISISVAPSETSEAPNEPSTEAPETTEPTQDPTTVAPNETETPKASPSSDGAAPPATQFAQRWGQKYPNVPEYAILKAANGTCSIIANAGNGWEKNETVQKAITLVASAAGLADNDALEFAQDANQNYCESVANPT